MSAYKEISEYFSEDGNKRASIIKEIGTKRYVVRLINDAGSSFSASYENIDDAEAYAEDWVS